MKPRRLFIILQNLDPRNGLVSGFFTLIFSAFESILIGILGSWWMDPHGGALGKRICIAWRFRENQLKPDFSLEFNLPSPSVQFTNFSTSDFQVFTDLVVARSNKIVKLILVREKRYHQENICTAFKLRDYVPIARYHKKNKYKRANCSTLKS